MKVSFPLLCLVLTNLCFGVDQLHKAAVLVLPERIEYRRGAGYSLSGEIDLRWDGAEPLRVDVWRHPKSGVEQLMPDITVFDEYGKEVNRQFFMSIPPMPSGKVVISKGERRAFRFFIWNGEVVFLRPGNYYAIAVFSDAWTGGTNVQFTTSKRWFKVVEAPPEPRSI